jgi:uncharacterized membrane protein
MNENIPNTEISSDDRLWVAIGYPIPILAILGLILDDKKNRPFIKFHSIQSIAFNLILFVVIFLLSFITFGFGAICAPILWLAVFWPAVDSYKGNYTQIPVLTDFMKKQGWV